MRVIISLLLSCSLALAVRADDLPLIGVGSGKSPYQGPGDMVSGATVFLSCFQAYTLSIALGGTTAGCNIRRASDNHACDVLLKSTGFWGNTANCGTGGDNGQTAASFCNATSCFVTEAYDQTGNAHHATQATAGNQPALDLTTNVGGMNFSGNSNMALSGTLPAISQPFSENSAHGAVTVSGTHFSVIAVSDPASTYLYLADSPLAAPSFTGQASAGTQFSVTINTAMPTANSLQAVYNGASSVLKLNGVSSGTVAGGAHTIAATTYVVGDDTFTDNYLGSIMSWGLWPTAFNASQLTNLCRNDSSNYSMGLSC